MVIQVDIKKSEDVKKLCDELLHYITSGNAIRVIWGEIETMKRWEEL